MTRRLITNSYWIQIVRNYLDRLAVPENLIESDIPTPDGRSQLSVIIPAYNEADFIMGVLSGLERQTLRGFEVVVVDNGSTDGTLQIVKERQAKASYSLGWVKYNQPGPGNARKAGMDSIVRIWWKHFPQLVRNRILVTTDADVVPPHNWLQKITKTYKQARFGAAGGPHKAAFWVDREIKEKTGFPRFFSKVASANKRLANQGKVVKVSGPNAAFEIEAYILAGGMRQPVQASHVGLKEVQELVNRIALAGYKIVPLPTTVFASRRRHLQEILKQQDMYFTKLGAGERFITVRDNEKKLLQKALKNIHREAWKTYQQTLIKRVENAFHDLQNEKANKNRLKIIPSTE